MKERLRKMILDAGAVAAGFAAATPVDERETLLLSRFVEEGRHAGMEFLRRHVALRGDPCNVLPGVRTIISCAFSFASKEKRDPALPHISAYALGKDYHDVLRRILSGVMEKFSATHPSSWRVCVDSAPLPERWWALRAGIGERGLNGSVIVDGAGPTCFLAEILTTLQFEPDRPSERTCGGCGRCVEACPTGALRSDGSLDARRCISYLTIEHRGEWDSEGSLAMATPAGKETMFGCDRCLRACPRSKGAEETTIPDFRPNPEIMALTAEKAASLTQEEFSTLFRGSPIKRARLSGLKRNLGLMIDDG